jgi:DNA-binding CsgD family transcriptional regulator
MTSFADDAYRHDVPDSGTAACAYCCPAGGRAADARAGDGPAPGWLAHLYTCQGLSTYQIAARTGVGRQRVTRALRKAGVPLRSRGAGRLRPVRRAGDPPDLPLLLRDLYEEAQLGSRQIAAILGLPERTVRSRLHRYGIEARSRGSWNREDRTTVPVGVLEALYVERGMTAAEVGRRLGVSGGTVLRSAHSLGVPVRSGGVVPLSGPGEIELVRALYADLLIAVALTEHGVPRVPAGGSLSQRFPVPVRLTTPLVKDLYWECGAGLNHIELLTGQPAGSIRKFMQRAGIPMRHPGGRTPFLRRWRSGLSGLSADARPGLRRGQR